jgi:hypothetical protein
MSKVTPEIISQIKALSKSGILQKRIARKLKLCRSTVSKIQRQAGMAPHPGFTVTPLQERTILQLLRRNYGEPRISQTLCIPAHAVRRVMRLHKYRRPRGTPGHRYKFSVEELRDIARDLRASEQRIAARWHTTRAWVSRFRNSWWDGNRRKKNVGKPASTRRADEFVQIVEKVCNMCFAGKLPATDDAAFVGAMMAAFGQTILQGQPQAVLDSFAAGLVQAVDCIRREKNSDWKN